MTKDAYYEMCETLGTEPIEEEVPVSWEDFPDVVQQAFEIYSFLADRWEGMSATFMGKDYGIVFYLFDTFDIPVSDRVLQLRIMSSIDGIRSKLVQQKQKQTENKKPSD